MVRTKIIAIAALTAVAFTSTANVSTAKADGFSIGIANGQGAFEFHAHTNGPRRPHHARGGRAIEIVPSYVRRHRVHGPRSYYEERISLRRAMRKLHRKGFGRIRFMRDRGNVYVFKAWDKYRESRVKIWVNAYNGKIKRLRRLSRR